MIVEDEDSCILGAHTLASLCEKVNHPRLEYLGAHPPAFLISKSNFRGLLIALVARQLGSSGTVRTGENNQVRGCFSVSRRKEQESPAWRSISSNGWGNKIANRNIHLFHKIWHQRLLVSVPNMC